MKRINTARRIIYLADALVVGVSLFILLGIIGYTQPMVIAPMDEYSTSNTSVLFSFSKADVILIDDNLEFTSPTRIYAKDNLVINLKPGKYYWKVEGVFPSEIRTLLIKANVDLRLRQTDGAYEVINGGNTKLNVKVYDNEQEIERRTLDVGNSVNASGTKFIGGQDE